MGKRAFDFALAAVGLVLLSPFLILVVLAIKLGSRGPVLFRQERVGRGFRPFLIYKFRTMVQDAPRQGAAITVGDDPRITWFGRILRKTKIDELPQLINVVKGDMSLVGPRPEVPKYVEEFREDYEAILQVRPGITGLGAIAFRDEATILGQAEDGHKAYIEHVLPEKLRLAKEYIRRASFWFDLKLILWTVMSLMTDPLIPKSKCRVPVGAARDGRNSAEETVGGSSERPEIIGNGR